MAKKHHYNPPTPTIDPPPTEIKEEIIEEDILDDNHDGKISIDEVKDEAKHVFQSKTIWVNLLALVAFFIQRYTGFIIDENIQVQALAVINVLLRTITKEPVKW